MECCWSRPVFSPKGPALSPENIELVEQGTDWATAFLAMIFGSIWGLIIFNIDRFIVASTGKGDGTEMITSGEIKAAIPRIIMGIIIAITISKPVELRMFKTEVDVELKKQQTKKFNETIADVEFQYNDNKATANSEIARLRAEVTESKLRLETLELQLVAEIQGAVAIGLEGFGPAAKILEDMIAIAIDEYDSISEINTNAIQLLEDEISLIRDRIYKLYN